MLREVKPGEPVSAEVFNEMVRTLKALMGMSVAPPLQLHKDSTGWRIGLNGWPHPELIELTEDLAAGGEADAKILNYDRSGGDWSDTNAQTVTIHDSIGSLTGSSGDHVWVIFSPKSGRWEAIQLPC